MPSESKLNEIVNYYLEKNDKPTARNYIRSMGSQIEGYNVEQALYDLDHEPQPLKKVRSKPEEEIEDNTQKESENIKSPTDI
jgi:replication initiation and membrane attachment protein DnaB